MAFILLATPKHPEDVQGAKGEIPVHAGTLRSCKEKREFWLRQGEKCRIVRITKAGLQEVE